MCRHNSSIVFLIYFFLLQAAGSHLDESTKELVEDLYADAGVALIGNVRKITCDHTAV